MMVLATQFIIMRVFIILLLFYIGMCAPLGFSEGEELWALNELQLIGSHNSYKIAIEEPLWEQLYQQNPRKAKSLQYEHPSLLDQLSLGLRSLELDVFSDPEGGHYSNPAGLRLVSDMGKTPEPYDRSQDLSLPGLKMFHIQDIDFRSHHLLFRKALIELREWSLENSDHCPVVVLINANDREFVGTRKPLPFTTEALNAIDQEIREHLGEERLITPDDVRGDFSSLSQAIEEKGWPLLKTCRGKFLFVLDAKESKTQRYLLGEHEGLKRRVMFVNVPKSHPASAFMILNDPIEHFEVIRGWVADGYLVRTRADSGTWEARTEARSRFEHAVKSGAQVISTDYYQPTTLFKSKLQIKFENGGYQRIRNECD